MNQIRHVQATVNTEGIIKRYFEPSLDENNPTAISHDFVYVVGISDQISGSGVGELSIAMNELDAVRISAVSASNNFEDAVLLYRVEHFGGNAILSDFMSHEAERTVVVSIEPKNKTRLAEFWFLEADVVGQGSEWLGLSFALYARDNQGMPVLHGYFQSVVMFSSAS